MGWKNLGDKLFKIIFGGGDVLAKEKVIIKKLKTCKVEKEILAMCKGLELLGSIYSFPTLRALLKDNQPDLVKRALQNAYDSIAFKYLTDKTLPHGYFSDWFWEPTWNGSKTEFLSFMMVLENVNEGKFDEKEMEHLAAAFIKELNLDISPYQTYYELRLCAADWDIEKDVAALMAGTQTDMFLLAVLEGSKIETEADIEEFIADQKNDYLLTRVGLLDNFEANHYVLRKTACLNRKATE